MHKLLQEHGGCGLVYCYQSSYICTDLDTKLSHIPYADGASFDPDKGCLPGMSLDQQGRESHPLRTRWPVTSKI